MWPWTVNAVCILISIQNTKTIQHIFVIEYAATSRSTQVLKILRTDY